MQAVVDRTQIGPGFQRGRRQNREGDHRWEKQGHGNKIQPVPRFARKDHKEYEQNGRQTNHQVEHHLSVRFRSTSGGGKGATKIWVRRLGVQ